MDPSLLHKALGSLLSKVEAMSSADRARERLSESNAHWLVVKALLMCGCHPDDQNERGETMLMRVIGAPRSLIQVDLLSQLLGCGARSEHTP